MLKCQEPFIASALFVVIFAWFLALSSNELRQFILAKRNNDVRRSYLTTTISGNIVDIMSLLFIFIGLILHGASIYVYRDSYPSGPLVIYPQFNNDQFILYCPLYLKRYMVISQESFHVFSIETWITGLRVFTLQIHLAPPICNLHSC